jgi:hypothetical protein
LLVRRLAVIPADSHPLLLLMPIMPVSFELGEVEAVVEGAEVVPVEREENSANLAN